METILLRRRVPLLCMVAALPLLVEAQVLVGRVDVSPSAGSTHEKPQARVVGAPAPGRLYAGSSNRGDWEIAADVSEADPKGRTLALSDGILIPSLNELAAEGHRGVIGVGGKLTTGHGSRINGGPWVAGFTAAGNGAEANYDFAFAYFPFADGWVGGHVAADGTTLLAHSRLPDAPELKRISGGGRDGEVLLRIPHIDTRYDGLLFTTAAGNGDDTTAASALRDGTGWHIRIADESHDFRKEQAVPFSFVHVPYHCEGLTAGQVLRDGKVVRGVGTFAVMRSGQGRYDILMPGKSDRDGILLLQITQSGKNSVEDNAAAWAYDAAACRGQGGFVVETYDQPAFSLQDCGFSFAFLDYRTGLSPGKRRASSFDVTGSWQETLLRGASPDAIPRSADEPVPWFSPVMHTGMPAVHGAMPVTGLTHVWLVADDVDSNGSDHSVWADAAFVMADGTRRTATVADLAFHHVGWGELETRDVTVAGAQFASVIFAHAASTLAVAVPPGAVRFEARVGIADPGAPNSSVRFAILDEPHSRGAWRDDVWPALEQAFPAECARLLADLGQDGVMPSLDMAMHRAAIEAGLRAMEGDLGSFADGLPLPQGSRGDSSLLSRYGAAARMLEGLVSARSALWELAPKLAELVDYPLATFGTLGATLEQVERTRPAQASEAGKMQRVLTESQRQLDQALRTLLTDTTPSPAALGSLARTVEDVAEWAGRAVGWTTYGGNNHRSWVCREQVKLPLELAWTYRPAAPPQPAWPPPRKDNPAVNHQLSPTLTYDRAFHPVAADGRLFFGSSAEDALICLDAETGAERWRFVTGGPVRLAPALHGAHVVVGSDDGAVYCLEAATGEQVWAYRADKGNDRRLCGNGRVISEWPVRAGICIDDGVVYAAAGIFPHLGTALFALDAETGTERWRRAIPWVPQGFMLLSPSRIFLPTGRTPFQAFDRKTGKPIFSFGRSNSWGSDLPGGTQAVVVNEQILTGPDEGGEFHLYDAKTAECVVRTPGRRMIVDGLNTFVLQGKRVLAQERNPFVRGGVASVKWSASIDEAYCMLRAGDVLLVGGDEQVQALNAADGQLKARIPVSGGRVEGLVWHGQRLLASMADGSIACFASPEAIHRSRPVAGPVAPKPAAADRVRARGTTRWAGIAKGYALVIGDPGLVVALARDSNLRIVLMANSDEQLAAWRGRFAILGLGGHRVSVHRLAGSSLPYRPFMFNLVVLPEAETDIAAAEWFRVLSPEGGLLVVAERERFETAARGVSGTWEDAPDGAGQTAGFRRGPVAGGGRWTHSYGDAGNTACSGDTLPFGEFKVLWFGRPGPRHMFQRHIKGAAPLSDRGTLYVTGSDFLAGVDAYNGTVLWENHLKGSGRVGMLKDCGNMVTADGKLYVAADAACHVIDGRTGRETARMRVHGSPLPDAHWGYVATADAVLVGSATRPGAELQPYNKEDHDAIWYHHKPVITSASVFALDRATGKPLWSYVPEAGVIANPTLTVLDGLVVFVESANTATRDDADGRAPIAELIAGGARLTALRLTDGTPAWRVGIDLTAFEHAIYMSGSDGVLVLTGTRYQQFEKKRLIQYQLVGVEAATGRELWRNDNTPSFAHVLNGGHGEQTQHPAIVGGKILGPGFTRELRSGAAIKGWNWQKSKKCGTLSTSLNCAFSRQAGNPTVADLSSGKAGALTKVTRPGCWINTLPVGGVVLIPEASSGCTCGYSIQTSLALYPVPEAGSR